MFYDVSVIPTEDNNLIDDSFVLLYFCLQATATTSFDSGPIPISPIPNNSSLQHQELSPTAAVISSFFVVKKSHQPYLPRVLTFPSSPITLSSSSKTTFSFLSLIFFITTNFSQELAETVQNSLVKFIL